MAKEFKLPELGENIDKGDLVRLMVGPGAEVSEGQPVMELETDKAVIEVPSTISGKVQDIRVKEGDSLKVGQVIFTLEDGATASKPAEPAATTTTPTPPPPTQPVSAAETTQEAKRVETQTAVQMEGKTEQEALPPDRPMPAPAAGGPTREFKLPDLGENVGSGDLVRLLIKPGDAVSDGQGIMELETDKAVVEVPSNVSGTVSEIRVKEGQKVKAGDVIFTYSGVGAAAPPPQPAAGTQAPAPAVVEEADDEQHHARVAFEQARKAEGKTEERALPPDRLQPQPQRFEMPAQLEKTAGMEHRTPVAAAPHVRRLAREIGVDIYEVKGTGPGGRITEVDVKAQAKQLLAGTTSLTAPVTHTAAAAPGVHVWPTLPDFSKWGKVEHVSMRGVRRKTAQHLWEAWNTVPHVTQHDKADITELEELRKRFSPKAEAAGGKMTVTAIALKVCASALKVFPQFNASIDMTKEEVVYKQYINIGLAVDTDRGLLVPVIRNVDQKNIIELAAELSQISKKARDKKLTPEEMEGGTFTITNLGGIGGTSFTPIVNHPEVAILGMSRSSFEPVWKDGQFVPRLTLPLSLSYDHRLVDGADAARFLRWVAEALEQPFLLSVQG